MNDLILEDDEENVEEEEEMNIDDLVRMKGIWNSIKILANSINQFHDPLFIPSSVFEETIKEILDCIDQIEANKERFHHRYLELETETTLFSILFSYIDRDKINAVRDRIIKLLTSKNRETDKLIEQAYEMHFIVRRHQQQLKKYYNLVEQSKGKDYCKVEMPIVPLINVYKKNGYVSDDITFINGNHARYICPNKELFKMSIDKHLISIKCDGLLDNIKWSDNNGTEVWLAGGCPFSALDRKWIGWLSRYKHFCEVRRLVNKFSLPMMINNTINRILRPFIDPLSGTDILPRQSKGLAPDFTREGGIVEVHTVRDYDFFIICKNVSDGQRKVVELTKQIYDYLVKLGHIDITIKRTCNTFTIGPFTIILPLFHSLEELLVGFDLDCCCVAYNGQDVYVHPRALQSYATRTNSVPNLPRSLQASVPSERVLKYVYRGIQPQYLYIHCKHIFCKSITLPNRKDTTHLCYSSTNLCQEMEKISISQLESSLGKGTNIAIPTISLRNNCFWASLQGANLLCMSSHHHKHCSGCGQPLQKSALGICSYCDMPTFKKISLTESKTIVICGRNLGRFLNRFEFLGDHVTFVTVYPFALYRKLYQMSQAKLIDLNNCSILPITHFNDSEFQRLVNQIMSNSIPSQHQNDQPLYIGQIINLLFDENRFIDYYHDNSGNLFNDIYTQLEIRNIISEEEIKTNLSNSVISQFMSIGQQQADMTKESPKKKEKRYLDYMEKSNIVETIKQDLQSYTSFIKSLTDLQNVTFKQLSFIKGLLQNSDQSDVVNILNHLPGDDSSYSFQSSPSSLNESSCVATVSSLVE
ncbi:hypothetical protein DFA_06413 [Cavenderia fasciculata]|uniref:Uncharacterized protein n=1 Tax=Cavenderia fasciculata TaxID=261658 RepID=F4PIX7_CACFS|nr:uncharacterized protein DFA_06413 [Cavenderia fasciculata]EGG24263.1 hypothetical protein DFA_06413 [Cavenderia fasciculata]|eukprot:XP_004362114.1 hypothetical protein DFA_06413 [Cavenderia fasciculata]